MYFIVSNTIGSHGWVQNAIIVKHQQWETHWFVEMQVPLILQLLLKQYLNFILLNKERLNSFIEKIQWRNQEDGSQESFHSMLAENHFLMIILLMMLRLGSILVMILRDLVCKNSHLFIRNITQIIINIYSLKSK